MNHPPQIIVQLIHIHGGLKGEILELRDPVITIGRLPSNTLRFPADEPGVSRQHARIERDGNRFKIIALKDKFGTFVNGRQVREAVLRNGDVIEFGSGGPKLSFNAEVPAPSTEPEPMPRLEPQPTPEMMPGPEWHPPGAAVSQPHPLDLQCRAPRNAGESDGKEELLCGRHADLPAQKRNAPLIIQYGPTIRSYQQLPVLIGVHANCDFVLQQEGICDQHAELFFHEGGYYIKDLTGQRLLRKNGKEIEKPVLLNQFDELEFGPAGPVFRFLGEGRLAEVQEVQPDLHFARSPQDIHQEPRTDAPGKIPPANFLSRLARILK